LVSASFTTETGPRAAGVTRFFLPSPPLARYVQFGFVLHGGRDGRVLHRLPTGRAAIYFAESASSREAGKMTLLVEGPRPSAFATRIVGDVLALKLRPGGIRALLGVSARDLRGITVSLDEIWGTSALVVAARMADVNCFAARTAILTEALERRCPPSEKYDPTVAALTAIIDEGGGSVNVARVVSRSGYSARTLLNKFDECVGVTPKQYIRLTRLRSAVTALSSAMPSEWASVAHTHGYCDQAHMTHEFRELTGLPPRRFLRNQFFLAGAGIPALGAAAVPLRDRDLYRRMGLVSEWLAPTADTEPGPLPRLA
jgi:methylphosphotriester-DNA--protein-cysteine methyltransferase